MNTITHLKLKGKRVLIRVDYNVPISDGVITDDFRIKTSLPTIQHCLNEGASVILMSHLGRPQGKIVPELSLDPVVLCLEKLLDHEIMFSDDCISKDAIELSHQMLPGEVHMLENLRFYKGETDNDPEFYGYLAEHGEIYINDAFGTAHRSHASNVGVPSLIGEAAIGFLTEKELKYLADTTNNPLQPCSVLLGGAKVGEKINLIQHMMDRTDTIILGGAMAFTFLKAQGIDVGASLVDSENLQVAKEILLKAKNNNTNIVLPVDVVAASKMSHDAPWRVANIDQLDESEAGYDIGPETTMNFEMMLLDKKTIIWNGPMGVSEIPSFSTGTQAIASCIRDKTEDGAISIVGGGDTASALKNIGITDGFSHISTGGGAFLQLMCGKQLPALEALHEYA